MGGRSVTNHRSTRVLNLSYVLQRELRGLYISKINCTVQPQNSNFISEYMSANTDATLHSCSKRHT